MFGVEVPDVDELMWSNSIIPGYTGQRGAFEASDLLQKIANDMTKKEVSAWKKVFAWLPDVIDKLSEASEMGNKLAAYRYLKKHNPNMSDARLNEFVTQRAGSPDFGRHGRATWLLNSFMIFANPGIQATSADIEAWRDNKASFTLKLGISVAASFFVYALRKGWIADMFEDDDDKEKSEVAKYFRRIQQMYDKVSQYQRMNYWVLPTGLDSSDGVPVFVRIPLNETTKVFHAITTSILERANTEEMAGNYVEDILKPMREMLTPGSINPAISEALNINEMTKGNNPRDDFHGGPLIPERKFRAGGIERWKAYGIHLASRYTPVIKISNREDTTIGDQLLAITGAGGFFYIPTKDYSYDEKNAEAYKTQMRARINAQNEDAIKNGKSFSRDIFSSDVQEYLEKHPAELIHAAQSFKRIIKEDAKKKYGIKTKK